MKNHLSRILDNIDVLVYVADLETYELLYINKYTQNIFGDIKGKICWQSIQTGQKSPCQFCTNDKILNSDGTPAGVYHWEFQNTVTDQWFDVRDSAIEWHDGRLVRLEVATDITHLKKIEESLQENTHVLVESQKIAEIGSYVLDIEAGTWESSKVLDSIFGIDEHFVRTVEGWAAILHPEDKQQMINYFIHDVLEKKGVFNREYRIVRVKDGEERWVHGHGELEFDENNIPVKMIGTIQDITERKLVEKEQERLTNELLIKNKELEQVLYVTSHDLRSPLVNVEGYSKELEYSLKELMSSIEHVDVPLHIKDKITPILKEDIPESLHYIRISVSKINTLLKGILTLSRLGRSKLTIAEIDMNKMMAEIIDSHSFRLKELSIKTDVSTLPDCKGDSAQINQVFSNLLENAVKYLDPERPGVIHISGYNDKNQSVYCMEDNGIGIAPEHQEKIFEIFYQLEPYRFEGDGMGLTIVMRIIEMHNGKIWIESELGRGSKFFVSLPKV